MIRHVWADKNSAYAHLVDAYGAGPFDGACYAVAQALRHHLTGGLEVLVNAKDQAQHAVVRHPGGYIWDAAGPVLPKRALHRFNTSEQLSGSWHQVVAIRPWREGDLPDCQDIGTDNQALSAIIRLFKPGLQQLAVSLAANEATKETSMGIPVNYKVAVTGDQAEAALAKLKDRFFFETEEKTAPNQIAASGPNTLRGDHDEICKALSRMFPGIQLQVETEFTDEADLHRHFIDYFQNGQMTSYDPKWSPPDPQSMFAQLADPKAQTSVRPESFFQIQYTESQENAPYDFLVCKTRAEAETLLKELGMLPVSQVPGSWTRTGAPTSLEATATLVEHKFDFQGNLDWCRMMAREWTANIETAPEDLDPAERTAFVTELSRQLVEERKLPNPVLAMTQLKTPWELNQPVYGGTPYVQVDTWITRRISEIGTALGWSSPSQSKDSGMEL